jgi:heptosyltransferase I
MKASAQNPRTICILRLSALGDVTHVVPVIRVLQEQWPDTQISWVIGSLEHRLLRDLPGVEFIVFDKRGGWRAVRKLRQDLRRRHFDVLLHTQASARANLLSCLVHAPIRMGWNRERCRDLHQWFVNTPVAAIAQQHQVEGFLEFPRALGLVTGPPRWDLPIKAAAIDWVNQHIAPAQPLLAISPCSSHVWRNWNPARYAAVADFAARDLGMQIVLTGGPSQLERETGAAIERLMSAACINLIGADTLEQSKALLHRADLLISPDSGPVHIASALGTDVLGLYAATWSRRSGPFNSMDLCVDRFPQAARKYRKKEPDELPWGTRIEVPGVMDLVQADDVFARLETWWQRRYRDAAGNPPTRDSSAGVVSDDPSASPPSAETGSRSLRHTP